MSRSVRKQKEQAAAAEREVAETEAEAEEEEGSEPVAGFQEIDKLQELGVNVADIKKLKIGSYPWDVKSFSSQTKHLQTLLAIKGISEAKVDKILEAASKLHFSSFMTGTEMLNKRKEVIKVTTGCIALDQLLGGGVETMSITEVFGEFRTGKTQLCHTLCVTTQLPTSMNGGNGKVAFIDTEGCLAPVCACPDKAVLSLFYAPSTDRTFRPERIKPIAERFGLDPMAALDNVVYARAFTHEHQQELIVQIAAKMVEDQYRLLIVDSVTALFRVDYSGRGELAERQQKLGRMMSKLQKIAEEFNVAVFITNQVCADPGGGAMFVADAKKPIGGHVLAHASTTRLSLRKGRGEQRICKIYDSPCLPETECVYQISNEGIIDAKD